MVHPSFASQRIPRPDNWEVPQLDERPDFNSAPTNPADSISDRLLPFLKTRQLDLRSWDSAGHVDNDDASLAFRNKVHDFLRFQPDLGGSHEWEPDRLLGRGAFGRVGLWVRRDVNGDIVDEVVVKEMRPGPGNAGMCFTNNNNAPVLDVLQEPVLQKVVNQTGCENIIHARGYKVDRPGRISNIDRRVHPYAGPHRLYLEYAPHNTLTMLIDRYRAWSQHLPEPFLWHVFHSLAHALKAMQQQPANCKVAGEDRNWPANAEIVHYDIKTDNVFLGYENLKDETSITTGGSRKLPYPTIKLADFGIARVTHPQDNDNNPWLTWRAGTDFFRTPESLHYGIGFEEPPNGPYRPIIDSQGAAHDIVREEEDPTFAAQIENAVAAQFKFLASANVWCVGKVMYDLATLSYEYSLQVNWAWRQSEYMQNNRHLLPDFNSTPFGFMHHANTPHNPGYSSDLTNLIGRCLEPRINSRITVDALIVEVDKHLSTAEDEKEDDSANDGRAVHDVKRRKLYYKGNEINDMPLGVTPFKARADEVADLLDSRFNDPDWPPIKLPAAKWQRLVDSATDTTPATADQYNYNVDNGRIWFENGPPLQPAPAVPAVSQTRPSDQRPSTNNANDRTAIDDILRNENPDNSNTNRGSTADQNRGNPQWRNNDGGGGTSGSSHSDNDQGPGRGAMTRGRRRRAASQSPDQQSRPQDQQQRGQTPQPPAGHQQDKDSFSSLINAMAPPTSQQQLPGSQGSQQPSSRNATPQQMAPPPPPPPQPQGQPRQRRRAQPTNRGAAAAAVQPTRKSTRIAKRRQNRQTPPAGTGAAATATTTATAAGRGRGGGRNTNAAGRGRGRGQPQAQVRGRGRGRGRGQAGTANQG